MCLYPRLFINKKYTDTKKNGGNIPPVLDNRILYVPVGCGNCIECRNQKSREWQARLTEDIKKYKNGTFITLTFSNESIKNIVNGLDINGNKVWLRKERKYREPLKELGYELDNKIATIATRDFLERWRKLHKQSLRHWFVTELGHEGTENIHLHGLIWDKIKYTKECLKMKLDYIWKYGHTWVGNYTNNATINYIIKYINKIDEKHKYYKSKVLCSSGIGANYINSSNSKLNSYNENITNETYRLNNGTKIGLPIYWRNKIYNEQEREKLWIEKLNKKTRWILGQKIDISKNMKLYKNLLKVAQTKNNKLGYGSTEKRWDLEQYEKEQRKINMEKRLSASRE